MYVETLMQARATQHRLAQAERAAKVRLERAEAMRAALAFLTDGAPRVDAARRVRDAVPAVRAALAQLHAAQPLTAALVAPKPARDADVECREWEKGRDEYLNWEANRILASMKRAPTSGA